MIERIFIPTVNRVDNQITYNNLPQPLKKLVTLVVQSWEADKYSYDCDYLVLPDSEEYHFKNPYCISMTRKFIYTHARGIKYAVLDDDLIFGRRNTKYFGLPSSMEKSQRYCTEQDYLDLFNLMDSWLDEDEVTVCGTSFRSTPPQSRIFTNNKAIASAFWINGKDLENEDFDKWDLTCTRTAEDLNFVLTALTKGYGNRVSSEFMLINKSVDSRMSSCLWESQTEEMGEVDSLALRNKFPDIITPVLDESGNQLRGGYKSRVKSRIAWRKAYRKKGTDHEGI